MTHPTKCPKCGADKMTVSGSFLVYRCESLSGPESYQSESCKRAAELQSRIAELSRKYRREKARLDALEKVGEIEVMHKSSGEIHRTTLEPRGWVEARTMRKLADKLIKAKKQK